MKKISFILLALFIMPIFALALTASPVVAATTITSDDYWGGGDPNITGNIESNILLGNKDPREIAAQVINVILGFLGIVAVIIVLAGGFKWMTAGGSEDKVAEARKMITAGVIGLAIVLGAFAIANFVINQLLEVTNAG